LGERLAGVLTRGDRDQFHVRMNQNPLDQFFAGITGRTDDGDFFRFHFLRAKIEQQSGGGTKQKPRRDEPAGFGKIQGD
jgi:hypothetical protein